MNNSQVIQCKVKGERRKKKNMTQKGKRGVRNKYGKRKRENRKRKKYKQSVRRKNERERERDRELRMRW